MIQFQCEDCSALVSIDFVAGHVVRSPDVECDRCKSRASGFLDMISIRRDESLSGLEFLLALTRKCREVSEL
jgi:hypothetical protein